MENIKEHGRLHPQKTCIHYFYETAPGFPSIEAATLPSSMASRIFSRLCLISCLVQPPWALSLGLYRILVVQDLLHPSPLRRLFRALGMLGAS